MRTVTNIEPNGMGTNQFFQWLEDAKAALLKVYPEDEAAVVVDWFRRIRGSHEYELMGKERVDHFLKFSHPDTEERPKFYTSVYASMMSRMWVYAPYIIQEAINEGELK